MDCGFRSNRFFGATCWSPQNRLNGAFECGADHGGVGVVGCLATVLSASGAVLPC